MQHRFPTSFIALAFALTLLPAAAQTPAPGYPVPQFRMVETSAKRPDAIKGGQIRLLVDETFPPFHYRDETGKLAGLNVEIAQAICSELRVRCETRVVPFADLMGALERGEGDVIISALRIEPTMLQHTDITRPFHRALGRFAVLNASDIAAIDQSTLSGKKIGVIAGSAHEAWLKRYFPESEIVAFPETAEARAALRAGKVDTMFGDAITLIYWIHGQSSQNCCKLVDGAFVDEAYFSQPLSFVVRKGRDDNLLESLDWSLDRLQVDGRFAEIFRRYVPLDPWAASASASPPTASATAP